jgi:hypothetical protein
MEEKKSELTRDLRSLELDYLKEHAFVIGDRVVYNGGEKSTKAQGRFIGSTCYVERICSFDENGVILGVRPLTKVGNRALRGDLLFVPASSLSKY